MVSLSALATESSPSQSADAQTAVCPVRALRIYIDRSANFGNRSSFRVLWWLYEGPSSVETKSVTLGCGRYHGGIYRPRFGKFPLQIRGHSTRAIAPPERGQEVCVFRIFAWQPAGLHRIPSPGFTSWTFSP